MRIYDTNGNRFWQIKLSMATNQILFGIYFALRAP